MVRGRLDLLPVKRTKKELIPKSLKPGVVPSMFPDFPSFANPRMGLPGVTSRAASPARHRAPAELAHHLAEDFIEAYRSSDRDKKINK